MKKLLALAFLLLALSAFSEGLTYNDLLKNRLENDSLYIQIKNNYEIARNTYKSTMLNAYLFTDLSTGNVNLRFNSDKTKSGFSLEPSASISSPMLNNLGVTISVPYSNMDKGNLTKKGVSANLFFDIYSQSRNKFNLEIDSAKYNLELAERNLKIKEELIEKKLLNEIKNIFSEYSIFLDGKMKLTMANLKYRQVLAQGYSKNSPKLSTAKFSLMRSERELKEKEFVFFNSFDDFLNSFKIEIKRNELEDFFTKLALSIPEGKIPELDKLTEENFNSVINADREFKNKLKQNKIKRNIFSAKANVKFNTMRRENKLASKNTKTKNIESGLSFNFPGCKFYTGAIFNLEPKNQLNPSFQFMFSINPIQIYNHVLLSKTIKLSEENEAIALVDKKIKFKKELKQILMKAEKLKWQENLYSQELALYEKNAVDHNRLFKRGIINELENKQAQLEYQQAVLRKASADIESLIFNIEINENFIMINSK